MAARPELEPTPQEALRAFRLANLGLYTRSRRRFTRCLESLPAGDGARGRVLMLSGLAARAECRWEKAVDHLGDASGLLLQEGLAEMSALCVALQVEARCACGQLDSARELASSWGARGAQVDTELPTAMLALASGQLAEALDHARAAGRAQSPWAQSWARLVEVEALLELLRARDAEAELSKLVETLEQAGEFDERYARALWLVARAKVEPLSAEAAAGGAELGAAERAVALCIGYANNLPRYQAGGWLLRARLEALTGKASVEATTQHGLQLLEQCGAQLDLARALASQSRFLSSRYAAPAKRLATRAKELLLKAGALRRAQELNSEQAAGAAPMGASLLMSRMGAVSMMARGPVGPGAPLAPETEAEDVELRAVFEVHHAISSTLSLEELLRKVLEEVVKVLKAERGALIRILPDGSFHCAAARGIDPERVKEGNEEISFSTLREVEKTGEVLLTDNAQLDERFRGKASVVATDIRSLLCAPLKTQRALLGFLYVDSTIKARVFKLMHKELMSVFATQAATAIEKAMAFQEVEELNRNLEEKVAQRTQELSAANESLSQSLHHLSTTKLQLLEAQKDALTKEMSLARTVQQSIIPPPEVIETEAAAVVGWVNPADMVGGDFWSHFLLPEGRLLLLVGDVTGHGLGSGMITVIAKACVNTLIRSHGTVTCDEMLAALSDVIFESSKGAFNMSAVAAVLDPRRKTLSLCNAGHPAPVLIERAEGLPKVTHLVGAGRVLGTAAGLTFEPQAVPYVPGDRLLVYTDGLVECTTAAGRPYGARRLRTSMVTHAGDALAAGVQGMRGDFEAYISGHPQEDDVTLVVAELK